MVQPWAQEETQEETVDLERSSRAAVQSYHEDHFKKKLAGQWCWESRVRGAVTRSRAAAETQRTTQVAR